MCGNHDDQYGVRIYTVDNGESTLRRPCTMVTKDEILHSSSVKQAMKDAHLALKKFREINGFGRAIAAPQVGHSIRMVALNLNGKLMSMFNPVIIETSPETFTMWDDCLSFPDLMVSVRRYKSISIVFLDENGEEQSWNHCPQDISELLQHEIDHLNNVLAVDIAERPTKLSSQTHQDSERVASTIPRKDWLDRRAFYNSLVDFGY